jgi:ubiquinone/menaquinone biosynthesis C-methylase UbiE
MKKVMCGNEMDRMPNWAFKMMAFMFNLSDKLKSPDKKLNPFKLQKGQTVVDYGSGTGRFLKPASELVGESGSVYAVDIHELAVESANRMIKKFGLKNVHPILTDGKSVSIPPQTADLVYALDMFHMVKDSNGFLKELCRITKPDGILFLEDGHQPRELSKNKVINSGYWEIIEETEAYMKCKPKNQTI